jgi:hypothetical protein
MADPKYIAVSVALKAEARDNLDKVRRALVMRLGFEPSRAEAVQFLTQYYLAQKDEDKGNG